MPFHSLKTIRRIATIALEEAKKNKKNVLFDREPINWAHLIVVAVAKKQYEDGSRVFVVEIEEASPSCPSLSRWMRDAFEKAGIKNVEIYTEW